MLANTKILYLTEKDWILSQIRQYAYSFARFRQIAYCFLGKAGRSMASLGVIGRADGEWDGRVGRSKKKGRQKTTGLFPGCFFE